MSLGSSVAWQGSHCFQGDGFFLLPASHRTKALVLELLAAVCLVRGGHEIILAAFENFKEVRAVLL